MTAEELETLKLHIPVWKAKTQEVPGLITQRELWDWLLIMEDLLKQSESAEEVIQAATKVLEDSKCDAGCWSGMDPCNHRVLHHVIDEWRKSKGELK